MGTTERKISKPKIRMKCFKCKPKREKKATEDEVQKKIEYSEKKKIENYSPKTPAGVTGVICGKEVLRLPSPLYVAEVQKEVIHFCEEFLVPKMFTKSGT